MINPWYSFHSEFIHIDESSFKINGKRGYAYVVTTKEIT